MVIQNIINIYTNYHRIHSDTDIPHHILPLSYRNFKKFYRYYFSATNLPDKFKPLYRDELDYEQVRSKLRVKLLFYHLRDLTILATSYIVFNKLFHYLEHQIEKPFRQVYPRFILTCLTTIGFNQFLKHFYYVDINDTVDLTSKLGIYLWFEFRFRQHKLHKDSINQLDHIILNDLDVIKNNRVKNELRIERVLFYLTLKRHYLSLLIASDIMVKLNGEKYLTKIQKTFFNEKFYWKKFFKSELRNLVTDEGESSREFIFPKIDEKNNDLSEYLDIGDIDKLYQVYHTENLIKDNIIKNAYSI
jgi:hypothetical protein